ncbi:MAG TPA: hypothetical protein VGJ26_01430 [Pirellulales bacterium]|jgi:hypothetical protein
MDEVEREQAQRFVEDVRQFIGKVKLALETIKAPNPREAELLRQLKDGLGELRGQLDLLKTSVPPLPPGTADTDGSN